MVFGEEGGIRPEQQHGVTGGDAQTEGFEREAEPSTRRYCSTIDFHSEDSSRADPQYLV